LEPAWEPVVENDGVPELEDDDLPELEPAWEPVVQTWEPVVETWESS